MTDIFSSINSLSKKVRTLCCQIAYLINNPTPGPQGPPGPAGTLEDAYHGSFLSIIDQSTIANVPKAIEYEVTDFSNGVSIVNNLSGRPTRITIANAGVYNIQFSAQLNNTDGGGSSVHVDIWLSENGTPVIASATKVSVTPNSPYMVAAWNFFVNASAGTYYELIWSPNISGVILQHEVSNGGLPVDIPSVILTVNRVA